MILLIKQSSLLKNNFYKYITRYCKSWDTEYQDYEVCDGTGWDCTIWIDDFKLVSHGYEAYPRNFKAFMNKLKVLTSGKIFKYIILYIIFECNRANNFYIIQ